MSDRELNEMQKAFVLAYVSGTGTAGNATKAAVAAGYSEHSARVQGQQQLAKSHVQAAIQREQRRAFSQLSNIALVKAKEMLESDTTPPGVKADIMKAVWDRGGLATVKAEEEKPPKELNEMTQEELKELIRAGQVKLSAGKEEEAGVH